MSFYDSTIKTLAMAPIDRPVSLLLRHSERDPIITRDDVLTAKLTQDGVSMAEDFGYLLSRVYIPGIISASPIDRCIQTAAAISSGARWKTKVKTDERLSYPLLEQAWIEYLDCDQKTNELPEAVQVLLKLLLEDRSTEPARLNIFVTHDSVLGCILAYLMNIEISPETWPEYLEGMVLWREGSKVYTLWRDEKTEISQRLNGAGHSL